MATNIQWGKQSTSGQTSHSHSCNYCGIPNDLSDFQMQRNCLGTIHDLKSNPEIQICRPDKGSGVVILNKSKNILFLNKNTFTKWLWFWAMCLSSNTWEIQLNVTTPLIWRNKWWKDYCNSANEETSQRRFTTQLDLSDRKDLGCMVCQRLLSGRSFQWLALHSMNSPDGYVIYCSQHWEVSQYM